MEQGEGERAERIEWVSLVVDVAILSVAISRDSSRVWYVRLHQGSLASLAHLLAVAEPLFDVPMYVVYKIALAICAERRRCEAHF